MPVLPVPVPRAVMVVPAVTPVPAMTCPTWTVPAETAVTVRVVPEIDPVIVAKVRAVPLTTPPCTVVPMMLVPVSVGIVVLPSVLRTMLLLPELGFFKLVDWRVLMAHS